MPNSRTTEKLSKLETLGWKAKATKSLLELSLLERKRIEGLAIEIELVLSLTLVRKLAWLSGLEMAS